MKTYLLNKVIEWLLGGDVFDKIKQIVYGLADVDAPGEKKREIAVQQAKELFGNIATFSINLAIEAAVFMLKEQAGKAQ